MNLSTGNFTIEGWIWYNDTASYVPTILNKDGVSGSSYPSYSVAVGFTSTYVLNAYVASGGGSPGQEIVSGTALPLRQWVHFAFVRSGTTLTIYQNGVSVVNATQTSAIVDAGRSLNIGYQPSSAGTAYFPGYISNVRIVKGTALYTTTFTPSTTPLTTTSQGATASQVSLLTLQSTTFIDNSVNNLTITANGNSQPTQQNPFGFTSATTNGYTPSTIGGSGYFDGTGDYLSYTGSLSLTGAFTAQGWFYNTTTTGTQRTLFVFNSVSGNGYGSLRADCDQANTQFNFSVNMSTNGSTWSTTLSTNSAYNKNVWNHFAVTRDSSNAVKVFINGVQIASGTQAGTLYNTSTTNAIGCNNLPGAATNPFNGYISDLQLINGTALYTSNFVPPAQPLTAVQNTALLTNMTSAGIYDAAMMNNMESVADAKLSTAVSKFGGSSMSFDGTGDYLTSNSATTDLYAFGSGNFTIEMWLYLNSVSGTQVFYDQRPLAGGVYPTLYMSGSTLYYYTNAANRITGSTLSTSQWYHIAVSRSGTSTKLFVNGTQSGSTYTDTNVYLNAALRPFIGGDGTNLGTGGLNGYIDDLRITKGYARYTSNFTAPTSAFPIF